MLFGSHPRLPGSPLKVHPVGFKLHHHIFLLVWSTMLHTENQLPRFTESDLNYCGGWVSCWAVWFWRKSKKTEWHVQSCPPQNQKWAPRTTQCKPKTQKSRPSPKHLVTHYYQTQSQNSGDRAHARNIISWGSLSI